MKLEIKECYALYKLKIFMINGRAANEYDFVDQYDHSPKEAEPYGCGDMQAEIIPPTTEVLNKYNISLEEYNEIAEKISKAISCGWCI